MLTLRKFTLLIGIGLISVSLSACGGEIKESSVERNREDSQKVVSNADNAKGLINSLKDSDVKFKMVQESGGEVSLVSRTAVFNGTYGYDNPKTGISTIVFANKNKLNDAQYRALSQLIITSKADDGTEISKVWSKFPNDASNAFPYQGARVKYATLTNIESKEESNKIKINAITTVYVQLVNGNEDFYQFKGSVVPDSSNKELDKEEVNKALKADFMNVEPPETSNLTK
ncbi:TPA: hypothetical protein IX023_001135 [Enterococcus faecium]|nr:hypothetical protein [Enterococcus faecium]